MPTIELSIEEMKMAAAALAVVAPSGGGSDAFHLSNKFTKRVYELVGLNKADDEQVQRLMNRFATTCVEEWLDQVKEGLPIAEAEIALRSAGVHPCTRR